MYKWKEENRLEEEWGEGEERGDRPATLRRTEEEEVEKVGSVRSIPRLSFAAAKGCLSGKHFHCYKPNVYRDLFCPLLKWVHHEMPATYV